MDDILSACNETELLALARQQGVGNLRRGIPHATLVAIVAGHIDPVQDHYSGTAYTRHKLEGFIQSNIERVRSQLPGCNGRCTVFPCSDGRHALCFAPNDDQVQ